MSTYEHGVHSPYVLHAIGAYERAFKHMEHDLAEGGPWLMGDKVTLADINLMPLVARLAYLGLLEVWTHDRPNVNAWWARAQEWPSFKTGLSDLISETEYSEMRLHGPKIKDDLTALLAGMKREMAAAK
jgi:glutathione S-transferase